MKAFKDQQTKSTKIFDENFQRNIIDYVPKRDLEAESLSLSQKIQTVQNSQNSFKDNFNRLLEDDIERKDDKILKMRDQLVSKEEFKKYKEIQASFFAKQDYLIGNFNITQDKLK